MSHRLRGMLTFWLLLAPTVASAQAILGPNGPVVKPNKEETRKKETQKKETRPKRVGPHVFKLTVDPAPEPVPALKHKLLIDYLDQKPGNAVPYYYRAVLSFQEWSKVRDREFYQRYNKWMEMPLSELPRQEVAQVLNRFHGAYRELKRATAREECHWDWRLRDLKGMDSIAFLLPEIQESRGLARFLALKARLEIKDRRYDEAIETLRVGYKLARDVAEPPTLINDLVGIAIASMMNVRLLELIDAPGSPNMYWALAELPKPLIDLRPAMQFEKTLPTRIFPFLRDAETVERSPEDWRALFKRSSEDLAKLVSYRSDAGYFMDMLRSQPELAVAGLILQGYTTAKQDLISKGYTPQQVETMPVGQVVAIHQAHAYRHIVDQTFKWTLLPYAEAYPAAQRQHRKLIEEGYLGRRGTTREILPIADTLLPATDAAMTAEVRLSARIAGLQIVEAIRLHAASHGGKLPAKLDDIQIVPVPRNELTGKPFPYRVDGKTASLEIAGQPGFPKSNIWRIEITIAASQP